MTWELVVAPVGIAYAEFGSFRGLRVPSATGVPSVMSGTVVLVSVVFIGTVGCYPVVVTHS